MSLYCIGSCANFLLRSPSAGCAVETFVPEEKWDGRKHGLDKHLPSARQGSRRATDLGSELRVLKGGEKTWGRKARICGVGLIDMDPFSGIQTFSDCRLPICVGEFLGSAYWLPDARPSVGGELCLPRVCGRSLLVNTASRLAGNRRAPPAGLCLAAPKADWEISMSDRRGSHHLQQETEWLPGGVPNR
jgi:hypothetical protein